MKSSTLVYQITASSDVYCVIGNPVKHSKSPIIHNFVFQRMGIDAVYVAFEVKELKNFFLFVKDSGIKGISITIPHKVEAMNFVDKVENLALKVGAINTVKNNKGILEGYNTDVWGIINSFKSAGISSLAEKSSLIIGSGGVARSCIWAFIEMGVSRISIFGRTEEKVDKLVDEVKKHFSEVRKVTTANIKNAVKEADIIANCTPVGMIPKVQETPIDPSLIEEKHIVFDTIYTPPETKLLTESRKVNAKTISGLEMFVFQALEQDRIWLETPKVYSLKSEVIEVLTRTR